MLSYKLSAEADQKLEEIYEYSFLHYGEAKADEYYNSLHETFLLLCEQPKLGRSFYEYRRHEHEYHVIFYKIENAHILIVRILHEKEEIEGKFD